uniref:Uncharacterized protein n=1 Tax=Oryza glumipatula TaxID=40148 RepID=A0A0E0ARM9_9ORYZ
MAAKSGEFAVVPVAAHPQPQVSHCASEPEPVAEGLILGKDHADAVAGVLARYHRAPFADRDARPRVTVAGTNGADVFARERGVSSRDAVLIKNYVAGMGVAVGEALRGKNLTAGLREVDRVAREIGAPLLDKKFFADDYSFARRTAAPPFAGLDKARAAPSAAHAEQVAIDVLLAGCAKKVPAAADAAAGADSGGNLATVVGIVAASSAVTMVAAGAVSPPAALGAFVLLLGGLFLAVSGVLED